MALWDFLGLGKSSNTQKLENLPSKLATLLPDLDDQARAKIAAIAGLFACVAQTDFHVSQAEKDDIANALIQWCKLSQNLANSVANLAIEEVAALASLEVHQYTNTLDKILNDEERVGLLESLFHLAASDGEVDSEESEFIRHITHGLRLDHHEFIAARATVLNHLKMLKNN